MRQHLLVFLLTLSMALGVAGCVTNPITGRSQFMVVSDARAAQSSTLAYNKLVSEASRAQALDKNPATLHRVRAITDRLVAQAVLLRPETRGWKWEVHVLEVGEVNAWCMAGGKMAIYNGLLEKLQPSDDEIAQVMSHEISHALLSHQAEKLSRVYAQKMGLGLGVIAGAVFGYDLRGVTGLADTIATVGLQLPNSREAESEADKVGIEIAAKAGYDPRAAISLWEKMLKVGGGGTPEWLSTHPDPENRLQALRGMAEQLMPVYEAAQGRPRQEKPAAPSEAIPPPTMKENKLFQNRFTPEVAPESKSFTADVNSSQPSSDEAAAFRRRYAVPQCGPTMREGASRRIPSTVMASGSQLSAVAGIALRATVDEAKQGGCAVLLIYPDGTPPELLSQAKKLTTEGAFSVQPFMTGGKDFFIVVRRGEPPVKQ
jgi:predicted Zn-dependent protease